MHPFWKLNTIQFQTATPSLCFQWNLKWYRESLKAFYSTFSSSVDAFLLDALYSIATGNIFDRPARGIRPVRLVGSLHSTKPDFWTRRKGTRASGGKVASADHISINSIDIERTCTQRHSAETRITVSILKEDNIWPIFYGSGVSFFFFYFLFSLAKSPALVV